MIDEKSGHLGSLLEEEAVDVVLFRGKQGAAVPVDGDVVVDLGAPDPLEHEAYAELIDSTVRLLVSADVPREAVDLLRQSPVPSAFQATPWLRHHRAAVLRDDKFALGTFVFTYDPDLGLCVHEEGEE